MISPVVILHATWPSEVTVDIDPDPDRELAGRERVVSSDAAVLDARASWVGLAAWIVATRGPGNLEPVRSRSSSSSPL